MDDDQFAPLVESTWRIRHDPAWEGAREALRQVGVDPNKAICSYFGGWGEAGCEFALPDGRLLAFPILLGWDGRFFVSAEDIEEEYPLGEKQKLALALTTSGDTGKFDAAVLKRFCQAAAHNGAAGETRASG